MTTSTLKPSDLNNFTGTEKYFKHWLSLMQYTEGVKYFAEEAGAFWFLDIVATEVWDIHKKEPFLSITMNVADEKAVIQVTDGNSNKLMTKAINFTDCPPGEWKFFLQNKVLMVTSEY